MHVEYDGSVISARVAPPTDSRTINHINESPPSEEQPGRDKHESHHVVEGREAGPGFKDAVASVGGVADFELKISHIVIPGKGT